MWRETPAAVIGSGSHEQDSTVGIVAMEEEAETGFMHEEGFGERQRQANKTSQALAQGIIPPFHMGGLPRLFAARPMLFVGNDRLIRRPEIGEADPCAIGFRDGLPEALTGVLATIPNRIGHDLAGSTTQGNPNPHLLALLTDKGPQLIQFEYLTGLGRNQGLAERWKGQPFF